MTKALGPGARIALAIAAVALFATGVVLTSFIPSVKLLGDNVRLPIFHGGSTWVSLMTFTLMGIFALAYLVTSREDLYRWASGFRVVSAPLWILNTVLGVIAALRTWDFSGTTESPLVSIRQDPRLLAQFELVILLLLVLGTHLLFSNRRASAFFDVVFVAVMWTLLGFVFMNPEAKALHPDNPVLNSGTSIQLPFFGIVGALFLGTVIVAWLWRDHLVRVD